MYSYLLTLGHTWGYTTMYTDTNKDTMMSYERGLVLARVCPQPHYLLAICNVT